MASDRDGLTPHRREHWSVEPATPQETPRDALLSPEETRVEAKRLLWRDSAIILVGIVLALLVAQFLPGLAPGLVADPTSPVSGPGGVRSFEPGASAPIDPTLGPVVDPSLAIDATPRPIPGLTLPPTGSFDPGETDAATPRPTRAPPATVGPPTAPPTPDPTPEVTPEVTPTPTDSPTDPPTDPPQTEAPSEP